MINSIALVLLLGAEPCKLFPLCYFWVMLLNHTCSCINATAITVAVSECYIMVVVTVGVNLVLNIVVANSYLRDCNVLVKFHYLMPS